MKRKEVNQRTVVYKTLETAALAGHWLSLKEMRIITGFGDASISAQMRHLHKPRYGRYRINKRYDKQLGKWQYQLDLSSHQNTQVNTTHTKAFDATA